MNKYLVAIAAFALTACGSQKKADDQTSEDGNNPVVITDAICMEAKGPVSEMEVTTKSGLFESIFVYKFNEIGELISIEDGQTVELGKDDIKMERDDMKRPVKMTTQYFEEMDDETPSENVVQFFYDGNSNLVKEEHKDAYANWTIAYTLDADGNATEYLITSPEGEEKSSIAYPEGAIDTEGNWTSRTLTSGDQTTTVTRKITYRN